MANNYLRPVNDHFSFQDDKLDDVEDDIFLRNSRSSTTSGSFANGGRSNSLPYDDEQRQIYLEKRRQIENRTLDSTHKSLGLLYETEEVGRATAAELAKQREQLEKTAHNLDQINASLRFSQKHLNSLKSVFGGLKNYLSGNRGGDASDRNSQAGSSRMPTSSSNSQMSPNTTIPPTSSNFDDFSINSRNAISPNPLMGATASASAASNRYSDHPINRLRDDNSMDQLEQPRRTTNPFEAQLAANLDEMCGNLSRLKCLATDLGSEIESQNDLLDNMNYKIEDVDLKLTKQNKEINRMLGKK